MISYIKNLFTRRKKLEPLDPTEAKVYEHIALGAASTFQKYVARNISNKESALYQDIQRHGLRKPLLYTFELTLTSSIEEFISELKKVTPNNGDAK